MRGGDVRSTTLHAPCVAASAFIGVLGVVNEHVTPATDGQTACTRPRGGPAGSRAPWPLYVTILHQLEVLLEISAERALGADGKWSVLAGVEAVKALLRLAVLRGSDARILINDLAPSSAPRALPWAPHAQLAAAEAEQCSRERAERTLRALAAFRRRRAPSACAAPEVLRAMSGTDAGCTLPPGARAPACIPRPPRLLQPDAAQQQRRLLAGEFLRLVRPVVYCLAVRRYGRGSWRPWLASLALDLSRCAQHAPKLPGVCRPVDVARQRARPASAATGCCGACR
jgi:peroxin-16